MKRLRIEIWGSPKGQPRPRARIIGNRAGVYNPKTADDWKSAVMVAVREVMPFDQFTGPVAVSMDFYLKRPKRLMRAKDPDGPIAHDTKPDIDNLMKSTIDAMTEVGVWSDDKLVACADVTKWYAAKGDRTGATVIVADFDAENLAR